MQSFEVFSLRLRHCRLLANSKWLWTLLRPVYESFITLARRNGLVRVVNGSDPILISPRFRHFHIVYEPEVWHTLMSHVLPGDIAVDGSDPILTSPRFHHPNIVYEPEVWHTLMSHVLPGDIAVDVGAFIGLYTVALAKRVGRLGKVFAFEPDLSNFVALKEHVELNGLTGNVRLVEAVVGDQDGEVRFQEGLESGSHVAKDESGNQVNRQSVTLDRFFAGQQVNILKIDVEGHELEVLHGATALLQDRGRCPHFVLIEAHPFAWPDVEKSSAGLLQILCDSNYRVVTIDGLLVTKIERWGKIIAIKN